jgi:ribosome biogenesis GTPase A
VTLVSVISELRITGNGITNVGMTALINALMTRKVRLDVWCYGNE